MKPVVPRRATRTIPFTVRYKRRMRWQWGFWRRRWSRAWAPGGAALKAAVLAVAVPGLASLVLWLALEIVVPGVYYPVGISLEMTAVWIAVGSALVFTVVAAFTAKTVRLRAVLFMMVVSALMVWCGAVGVMTVVNGAFDDSDPQTHTVIVLDRSYWTTSRRRFFTVASWRPGEREVNVWIDSSVYFSNPARVTVTTRSGAMGFEWVESVKE